VSHVTVRPATAARRFIPPEYLPEGQDEYYLRRSQNPRPEGHWRRLHAEELETLVKNGVTCDDWDNLFVTDPFLPHLIKNCEFSGLVRIGRMENVVLEHHEMQVPAGISNSLVIDCDLGGHAAIHNVRYLAHFILGDRVVLLNIDEMHTTNHAKFGNGIVKQGEPESVRIRLDLMNEAGGRAVMPFDGMTPADAYLWAKYRDDALLQAALAEMTQRMFDARRGFYGTVGDDCVIKNCGILKDVKIGCGCYIKGANKLKNLTIHSSRSEPTQIGEGVEMVNGIVGLGCHVFYGSKAVRFVMGDNSHLKYGARLIHSYLGDNSTVSCCEILNNLVFPGHEQHHNNSFLVAALVKGQSNMAAGATIGSNHNSRANDGELEAGRGFWPGLCTTVKHPCRFASFILLAQGDYPTELDVPLPFSLVADDPAGRRLLLTPAYWWVHNMYALARNAWKYQMRDRRAVKRQHIELDYLAPDTAEEIFEALRLLERWTGRAACRAQGNAGDTENEEHAEALGRSLLAGPESAVEVLDVLAERVENSSRAVVVRGPRRAWHAYREMLHYYAVKNLLVYLETRAEQTPAQMAAALAGPRQRRWVNLGGQLVPEPDVDRLRRRIAAGELNTWPAVHEAYDRLWESYPLEKQHHAFAALVDLLGVEALTPAAWSGALDEAVRIQESICRQVRRSRAKDFENPFRRLTFRNDEEMRAVLGGVDGNGFVRQVAAETAAFQERIEEVRRRGWD
jgi:hypothetical protein